MRPSGTDAVTRNTVIAVAAAAALLVFPSVATALEVIYR
jgi:hypothetical protein